MDLRFSVLKGRGMHIFLFWLVVILVVAVDQATKAAAIEVLEDGPKTLLPGIMNLIHVENTGAAFSLGQGGGVFFVIAAVCFFVASTYFVWSEPDLPFGVVVSIGLVAGGGLGNMIDRLMNGSVTDFLATAFMDFPVFNVADMCVTVGIVCAVVGYWLWDSRKDQGEGPVGGMARDGESHAS